MDREGRVEQVSEADPVRLGDEPEEGAVAIEAPGATGFDEPQSRLVVPVEDLVRDAARWRPIDQGERIRPVPLDSYDGD